MSTTQPHAALKRTPLYDVHVSLGAKMVPFAGYDMPVQYPLGVLKEHLWTREQAGLFDVSHMGQAILVSADGVFETAARALEKLVPADVLNLEPGQQRYSQLLAADGGILDDLMITRPAAPTRPAQSSSWSMPAARTPTTHISLRSCPRTFSRPSRCWRLVASRTLWQTDV